MILVLDGRWLVERQHGRTPCDSLCQVWLGCPPGTCPRSPGLPAQAPPASGWGWSPSHSGGWHKLAPAVQTHRSGMASSLELLHTSVHHLKSQDLQFFFFLIISKTAITIIITNNCTSCCTRGGGIWFVVNYFL